MVELALRNKTAEILSKSNNPEIEMDFRANCSVSQINPSLHGPPLMQAYQDYLNSCQHGTSLYNLKRDNEETDLIVYNTETKTQEVKTLQTPQPLDLSTSITQLPNGKLFCFGNCVLSGYTVLIDTNGGIEVLPSGTPCEWSSCIYFNNSVYCFGGDNEGTLTLSSRFDLIRDRWIKLTPMPKSNFKCNSIIFNGNILISGYYYRRNLLLYSIDIDSFSTIPYEFATWKRKVLINAERLYLIECDNRGDIYESEIGSYMNWRPIGKTTKINCRADQVYCSYNKGEIYIGIDGSYYFKFDLNEKRLNELKI